MRQIEVCVGWLSLHDDISFSSGVKGDVRNKVCLGVFTHRIDYRPLRHDQHFIFFAALPIVVGPGSAEA